MMWWAVLWKPWSMMHKGFKCSMCDLSVLIVFKWSWPLHNTTIKLSIGKLRQQWTSFFSYWTVMLAGMNDKKGGNQTTYKNRTVSNPFFEQYTVTIYTYSSITQVFVPLDKGTTWLPVTILGRTLTGAVLAKKIKKAKYKRGFMPQMYNLHTVSNHKLNSIIQTVLYEM